MSTVHRRTVLQWGLAAGGSIAFTRPLRALQEPVPRIRSVIWLWMDGGMSQLHTWDPKPENKNSGGLKAIETAVPGIQLGELMPVCASQMSRLSVIRSMSHSFGDHAVATHAMHVGAEPRTGDETPPIGTILARELRTKEIPLPSYLTLDPPVIPHSAVFGDEYIPFRLQSLWNPIPNIRSNVASARDRERAALLIEQSKEWGAQRQQRVTAEIEHGIVQSEALMSTPLLKVFNLTEEPAALRKEYGEGFGQGCLLARRLVEAGCPMVEIGLRGWGETPAWAVPYKDLVPALDRGLGTLVKELAEKNLLKETVVVCATEFGKPPVGNGEVCSNGFSVVLAGGALQGGRVYGETGANGTTCKSPVSIKDLFATIYKACGVDPEKQYEINLRKYKYVAGGKPVDDLF